MSKITHPAANPPIPESVAQPEAQASSSDTLSPNRFSRRINRRWAIQSTARITLGLGFALLGAEAASAQPAAPPTDTGAEPPSAEPVGEKPREWDLIGQTSYDMNPGSAKEESFALIPDIPYQGKEIAVETAAWSDNNPPSTTDKTRGNGGVLLVKGGNSIGISFSQPENRWQMTLRFGPQIAGRKLLDLEGQDVDTRFELPDGSTFVYRNQNGEMAATPLNKPPQFGGGKLDFYAAEGPVTALVYAGPYSHINVKNITVLTREKAPGS
ncbi:hypothetical protein HYS97_01640 [Candidatus Daviesbacteria bacterium]|nr:hypothetical protein [Candidatus Daviesbacteria bacterium]